MKEIEILILKIFDIIYVCGSIHDWGTKKECLTKKKLQMTTLDFCLFYITIIVVDCCMPIDEMMFLKINKNILK